MAGKRIITIFGSTGNQGGSVVKTFLSDPKLKSDWAVRGVTRNVDSESAKKLSSQGVEMVAADMNDKESLLKAVTGASAVFGVTNYWEKMDHNLEFEQGKKLADAVKEAGVNHYIWSSLKNVTELTNGKLSQVFHFDSKARVEKYIRELGIPATFFLPGFFMSNLPGGMFRQTPPENNWTLALPVPADTAKFPMFDTADSGKWLKAIVLNRDKLLGKQVFAATNYMTPTEIVDEFKKAFPEAGKTASFFSVPHDMYINILTSNGMPEFAAKELLENMRLMEEGGYYGHASLDESHSILEDELTTWEEYMKKAPAFAELK